MKEIHTGVAAASDKVDKRLVTANEDEQKRITKQAEAKQAYEKWEAAFMASHGHEPSKDERWAYILHNYVLLLRFGTLITFIMKIFIICDPPLHNESIYL